MSHADCTGLTGRDGNRCSLHDHLNRETARGPFGSPGSNPSPDAMSPRARRVLVTRQRSLSLLHAATREGVKKEEKVGRINEPVGHAVRICVRIRTARQIGVSF